MKTHFWKPHHFPLLIPIMLILLIGISSYQLSRQWHAITLELSHGVRQTVLQNTLIWRLKLLQEEQALHPKEAQAHWQQLRKEAPIYLASAPTKAQQIALTQFLKNDANNTNKHITAFLKNYPVLSKEQSFESTLNQKLLELDQQTHQSILILTTLMAGLGLILVFFITREIQHEQHTLKQATQTMLAIQEAERRRIAQDLHDEVIQSLIALKRDYSPAKADQLIHSVRTICRNLKPHILEEAGLAHAIESLLADIAEYDITVHASIESQHLSKLDDTISLTLFRVLQELLSNVKRHAQASHVWVSLLFCPQESEWLRLVVSDDGCGFVAPTDESPHSSRLELKMGLLGIQERIRQLGGQVQLNTNPQSGSGPGAQVIINLPTGGSLE